MELSPARRDSPPPQKYYTLHQAALVASAELRAQAAGLQPRTLYESGPDAGAGPGAAECTPMRHEAASSGAGGELGTHGAPASAGSPAGDVASSWRLSTALGEMESTPKLGVQEQTRSKLSQVHYLQVNRVG